MLKNTMAWMAAGLVALTASSLPARAQSVDTLSLPENTKLIVQVDVEAMKASGFGKRLIELISARVMEQVADQAGIGVPTEDDVVGFIGFNPIDETRAVTIAVTDFETPAESVLGIVSMKKTTGSLESMLPSVPGYSVKTVGKHEIHSGSPDGNMQICVALHTCGEGMKTMIVCGKEDTISQQLARMDSKSTDGQKCIEFKSATGVMLNVNLVEFPAQLLDEGQRELIGAMVKQLTVQLSETDGKLNLVINVTTPGDENAEQLDQMLQGLVPMVEGQLGGTALELNVSREGKVVTLSAKMDAKEAENLLEDQFDSAVGMIEGLLVSQ